MVLGLVCLCIGPFNAPFLLEARTIDPPAFFHNKVNKQFRTCPFPQTWKATPAPERGALLLRAAAIMRERKEDLARMDVVDNGKPIWEAR